MVVKVVKKQGVGRSPDIAYQLGEQRAMLEAIRASLEDLNSRQTADSNTLNEISKVVNNHKTYFALLGGSITLFAGFLATGQVLPAVASIISGVALVAKIWVW